MSARLDQRWCEVSGQIAARFAWSKYGLVALAALTAGCVQPANAQLMHMADIPQFEGGETPSDCQVPEDVQQEMQSSEYRCVVVDKEQSSALLDAHLQALRHRGWASGGMAGSAVWVLMPMGGECAQVYAVVANDYPRGATTPNASGVLFDLLLEQRLRCGDERNLM